MRPEHLLVRSDGVHAEVVVVEPTGADTQIFCKVGGTDVIAVVRERHTFKPGEAIRLYPELTFLFDPSSGASDCSNNPKDLVPTGWSHEHIESDAIF